MGFAAPGQLIDRYPAVFLPGPSGCDRGSVSGVSGQSVANLTPAANQAIEMGQVSLDLRLQAFTHCSYLVPLAGHVSGRAEACLPGLTCRFGWQPPERCASS